MGPPPALGAPAEQMLVNWVMGLAQRERGSATACCSFISWMVSLWKIKEGKKEAEQKKKEERKLARETKKKEN